MANKGYVAQPQSFCFGIIAKTACACGRRVRQAPQPLGKISFRLQSLPNERFCATGSKAFFRAPILRAFVSVWFAVAMACCCRHSCCHCCCLLLLLPTAISAPAADACCCMRAIRLARRFPVSSVTALLTTARSKLARVQGLLFSYLCPSPELQIIRSYDARNGRRTFSLRGHRDNIRDLILLRTDGQSHHLLSASSDHTVKMWDLRTCKCLNTYAVHHDSVCQ